MTGTTMTAVANWLDTATALSFPQQLAMKSDLKNPLFTATLLVFVFCFAFGIGDMLRCTLSHMLRLLPTSAPEEPVPMKLKELAPLITKVRSTVFRV